MIRIVIVAAWLIAQTGLALASGAHSGDGGVEQSIGERGLASEASRTVTVIMGEDGDGKMSFSPDSFQVAAGETVRMKLVNMGQLDHEFVMGSHGEIMEHKAAMEMAMDTSMEMPHHGANSMLLAPGATGEIVWKFAGDGDVEFGCLIPGHYDAGMKGVIAVRH